MGAGSLYGETVSLSGLAQPVRDDDRPPADARPLPPILRGWLHLVCFFVSLPAGAFVVATATSARGRLGALVYATGLSALFGVSGAYHRRRWTAVHRARMKRIDHATIFVMIAGTYTPLCLLTLQGPTGARMLAAVWVGAAIGVALAATGIAERPVVGLTAYIGFGWLAVIVLPALARHLSAPEVVLLVVGGVVYTAGAIVLGTRRPNPFPRVFGYHEVWHVMVVVAAACHFLVILSVVATTD